MVNYDRLFMRKHLVSFAIILFVALYTLIVKIKPGFLYNNNGSLRLFGIGYKKKTIIPVWLVSITLAILSYLLILYYLVYPRLHY